MGLPGDLKEIDKLARRIAYLIHAFITETISEEEHDELDDWVCTGMKNQRLFEELVDPDVFEKNKIYGQIVSAFLNPN